MSPKFSEFPQMALWLNVDHMGFMSARQRDGHVDGDAVDADMNVHLSEASILFTRRLRRSAFTYPALRASDTVFRTLTMYS